jgi:hypothetical protein
MLHSVNLTHTGQMGAKLLNILDYQMVTILNQVSTGNFFYLAVHHILFV